MTPHDLAPRCSCRLAFSLTWAPVWSKRKSRCSHNCSPLGLCSWGYSLLGIPFLSSLLVKTKIYKTTNKNTCLPLKGQFKSDFLHEVCRSRPTVSSVSQPWPCATLSTLPIVSIILWACLIPTTSWGAPLGAWPPLSLHVSHAEQSLGPKPMCYKSFVLKDQGWSGQGSLCLGS